MIRIFKNIDLSKITFINQIKKTQEEDKEFLEAIMQYKLGIGSREHVKEEICDKFQAALGLAEKQGIPAEEIEEYFNTTHVEKIKNRPRQEDYMKQIMLILYFNIVIAVLNTIILPTFKKKQEVSIENQIEQINEGLKNENLFTRKFIVCFYNTVFDIPILAYLMVFIINCIPGFNLFVLYKEIKERF